MAGQNCKNYTSGQYLATDEQKFAIAIPSGNGVHDSVDYKPPLSAPASGAPFFQNYMPKSVAGDHTPLELSKAVDAAYKYWTAIESNTPDELKTNIHNKRPKNPAGQTPLEHLLDTYCSLSDFHEYASDIHWHLLCQELKTLPRDCSFMHRQPHIEYAHRRQLVEWLMEVACYYNLKIDTLQLAVNLLDRYSSKKEVSLAEYQSLGTMCLWIAAKYEENHGRVPTLKSLIAVAKHPWKASNLCRLERQILSVLSFNIGHPFVETFRRFNRVKYCQSSVRHGFLSQYLTELLMPEPSWLNYRPSIVAQATMNLASAILNEPLLSPFDAATQECFFVVRELLGQPSNVVHRKYSSDSFHRISELSENWDRAISQIYRSPDPIPSGHYGVLTPLHTPGTSGRSNSISIGVLSGSPQYNEPFGRSASPISVAASRNSSHGTAGSNSVLSTPGLVTTYLNQRRLSLGYSDADMSPLSPGQSKSGSPTVSNSEPGTDMRYLRRRQIPLSSNHYGRLSTASNSASTPHAPGAEAASFITPSLAVTSRSYSNGLLPSQGSVVGSTLNKGCPSIGLERAHKASLINQGMQGFTPQIPAVLNPVQNVQQQFAPSSLPENNFVNRELPDAENWTLGSRGTDFSAMKRSGSISYFSHLDPVNALGVNPSTYPYLASLVQSANQSSVSNYYTNNANTNPNPSARPPPAIRSSCYVNSGGLYINQN